MPSVCFYFQVHQPFRLKRYRIFDIGVSEEYFNDNSQTNLNNKKILEKVATKCYLPTNKVLATLLKRYPKFAISFSFSGVLLEQLAQFHPETLNSFKELAAFGKKRVEILSETYYHSLAFLYSKKEFRAQVRLHRKKIRELFRQTPSVFRNTELIYSNEIAREVEAMGYKGILAEGADAVLGWRSPNFVYRPTGTSSIKLLLKNYKLSDDIAFRFSSRQWGEYPLTADKFANWVSAINGNGQVVNLFMDYETFGEHQWADTGIFEFLEALPEYILKHKDNDFVTPSQAIVRYEPVAELDVPQVISWADVERDLSAWISNPMQQDALRHVYALEKEILKKKNAKLIHTWRKLQTSDHFYYMCTKWFADGDVHKYFNPYESPYEAFIAFMNVLQDVRMRLESIPKNKNQTAG